MATASSDIESDAVPEDCPTVEDVLTDQCLRGVSSLRMPVKEKIPLADRETGTSDNNDEHAKYLLLFPPNLKNEDIDFLIINVDEDDHDARLMKEDIEKIIWHKSSLKTLKPRVDLLGDLIPTDEVDPLDDALPRTFYILLFVTENFLNKKWETLQGYSCLKITHSSKNERCTVVCVHTADPKSYKLPTTLNGAKSINYFKTRNEKQQNKFEKDITDLLKLKSHLVIQGMHDLNERRKHHLKVNPDIVQNYSEYLGVGSESADLLNMNKNESCYTEQKQRGSKIGGIKKHRVTENPIRINQEQQNRLPASNTQMAPEVQGCPRQRSDETEKHSSTLTAADSVSDFSSLSLSEELSMPLFKEIMGSKGMNATTFNCSNRENVGVQENYFNNPEEELDEDVSKMLDEKHTVNLVKRPQ